MLSTVGGNASILCQVWSLLPCLFFYPVYACSHLLVELVKKCVSDGVKFVSQTLSVILFYFSNTLSKIHKPLPLLSSPSIANSAVFHIKSVLYFCLSYKRIYQTESCDTPWNEFIDVLTLKVFYKTSIFHQLRNNINWVLQSANSIKLYKIWMPQVLHYLCFPQKVLCIHWTWNNKT